LHHADGTRRPDHRQQGSKFVHTLITPGLTPPQISANVVVPDGIPELTAQSGTWGSVQLALEEQASPHATVKSLPHFVSPLVRLRQKHPPQVTAQVAQAPLLQLGVAPPQTPQLSVPPQPSGAVPQLRPNCAQVFGMQMHRPFWHCSCPVQGWQVWPGRPQF
jgi:hypothetical protein